jgi:hypothetical protein
MQDTSFVVLPIPEHAFFEHTIFQGEISNDLFEIAHLVFQIRHFTGCRLTRRITRKTLLSIRLWARTNGASKAHSMNSFDQV